MKKLSSLFIITAFLLVGCASVQDALFTEKETYIQKPDGTLEKVIEVEPSAMTQAVVKGAGALPVPYLETALGVLLAGSAAYIKRVRNQRTKLESITGAVISGVEAFSNTEEGKEVSKVVKKKIQENSTYLGIDKELHEKVQKIVRSGKND